MKCQIKKITNAIFSIRQMKTEHCGTWYDLDIPEEIYEEIKKKLHGKPFTGIHKEIMRTKRGMIIPSEVVLDYLYNNGFDYMFEE